MVPHMKGLRLTLDRHLLNSRNTGVLIQPLIRATRWIELHCTHCPFTRQSAWAAWFSTSRSK